MEFFHDIFFMQNKCSLRGRDDIVLCHSLQLFMTKRIFLVFLCKTFNTHRNRVLFNSTEGDKEQMTAKCD